MKGLLYKEIKQNAFYLVLTAIVPPLVYLFPMFVLAEDLSAINAAVRLAAVGGGKTLALCAVIGFAAVGELQSLVFGGDDAKRWAYFVAAGPEGIEGFLYAKYMLVLGMSGILLTGLWAADGIYGMALYLGAGVEASPLTELCVMLAFLQMLLRAVDIPFLVWFGVRQGGIVKLSVFVCAVLLSAVLAVACPEAVVRALERLLSGDGIDLGRSLVRLTGLLPWAAIGAYAVSYRISCRVYRRRWIEGGSES